MGSLPAATNPATASGEVLRTNMQPQVGTNELLRNTDNDSISAIDAGIEHLENQFAHKNTKKINQFKVIWQQMKQKWSEIKGIGPNGGEEGGLGTRMGDMDQRKTMQQNPNMVPANEPVQNGPGTFGNV